MPNLALLSAAGSGKTEKVLRSALTSTARNILITTYTVRNTLEIKRRIEGHAGRIPKNIQVLTWFEFLLRHGIRPYQAPTLNVNFTRGIDFENRPPDRVPKSHLKRYFFSSGGRVYKDRVSDLVCLLSERSDGAVVRRLEGIFDEIYIDEVQDLSGHDLDFIGLLLRSSISVTMVGDIRQATYTTTKSSKNKAISGAGLSKWFAGLKKAGMLDVKHLAVSHRCNKEVCAFADALYPELPPTTSLNFERTGHDGIFWLRREHVEDYVREYRPEALRWNKADRLSNETGLPCTNFGAAKGCTFDRVLIFPTKPIEKYLRAGDLTAAGALPWFYVAVTRARHSVAFVIENTKNFTSPLASEWSPSTRETAGEVPFVGHAANAC